TTMYIFGVTGTFGGGLLEFLSLNWIPLFNNHGGVFIRQIIIGLIFFFIYYFIFKFLIEKLDINTPGRGDQEVRLFMKEDVKEKQQDEGATASSEAPAANDKEGLARQYIQFLGGDENIEHLTNCATRLRVQVKDPEA